MGCRARHEGFECSGPDLLRSGGGRRELGRVRETEPVWGWTRAGSGSGFGDEGYWGVRRHAGVEYVCRNPELFSSGSK
ncbi:steroid C27-monooxygenase, partial [Streptomyces griseus]|nr:steroid C27-monooxygenase [Streptomyces griseus]